MTDADIETQIKSVLDTGLAAAGISAIVFQSFQPTRQGPPLLPNVLFTKISAHRWGHQAPKLTLIPGSPDTFQEAETYYLRATYQVTGHMDQDHVAPASLNTYDVIDRCAAILQSVAGRATFKAAGIGIDRISDIRTPRSLDDSDRFDMDASFDFVLSYKQEFVSIVPEAAVSGTVEGV